MAEEPESIDELKAEIAQSRERLARDLRGLRYELDFPGKFRRSFQDRLVPGSLQQPQSGH